MEHTIRNGEIEGLMIAEALVNFFSPTFGMLSYARSVPVLAALVLHAKRITLLDLTGHTRTRAQVPRSLGGLISFGFCFRELES